MGEIDEAEACRLRRCTGRPKPDLLRVRMSWLLCGTGTGTARGGKGRDGTGDERGAVDEQKRRRVGWPGWGWRPWEKTLKLGRQLGNWW